MYITVYYLRHSSEPFLLPGSVAMSVLPRIPHTGRDSMARGVTFRDSVSMHVLSPGASLSITCNQPVYRKATHVGIHINK